MRIFFTLLTFSLLTFISEAQVCCKDTLYPADPFYQCNDPLYRPVCGCDGLTYRNACAAEHWGGLVNNGFCLGWTEGSGDGLSCGNFDFDFIPSGVTDQPVTFSVFMKVYGTATLYIYNKYGALVYTEYLQTYQDNKIATRQIDLNFLTLDIYIATVVVNNEKLTKKFGKLLDTTR